MLRTLASRGIFAQQADGRFALTPLADALRSDAPTSVRGIVLFWGDQRHWEHWEHPPHTVQTGQPAVDSLRGKPMFDYLLEDPEFAAIFNDGMTSVSDMEIPPLLATYDFTGVSTIVDVGGGHGRLLAAILQKWPQSRGILFDAESVVEGAPAVLDAAGVADRCTAVAGSFFESVPSGGDAYVLKHIVHDWDDSTVLAILRNVRARCLATQSCWSSRASCPTTTVSIFPNCSIWKCPWSPRAESARQPSTRNCCVPPASASLA
jgi:O-methyltransferase domain